MNLSIQGTLDSLKYRNPENLYTVAVLRADGVNANVTIAGTMPAVAPGQRVRVTGKWSKHPRFGRTFIVSTFESILPSTVEGILGYLSSGVIKGIGPSTARRIIDRFGDRTLEIMEKDPKRLADVPGIGPAKAAMIGDAWRERHASFRLVSFLAERGIDTSYAFRLFKEYGEDALDLLTADPFQVARDLPGWGFVVADAVARASGIREDDPSRARACVLHILDQAMSGGDLFVFENRLCSRCEELFHLDMETVQDACRELSDAGEIVVEDIDGPEPGIRVVWPARLYEAEAGAAARIRAMLSLPIREGPVDSAAILERVVGKLAIKPSERQLEILENIASHRFVVVTGGPGTGKTTLIRAIAAMFGDTGKKVALAAPTGRAAKRLSEVSGRKATTIHRLLGIGVDQQPLYSGSTDLIDADLIVIDEASMVDILLFYQLICAAPVTSSIVLVGDADQLPPVGPGLVLRDLIDSGVVPVFSLSEVFRQAGQSAIVRNAHHVRKGEPLEIVETGAEGTADDFWFIEESDPDRIASTIVELCVKTLPGRFGFDPVCDIQVLTPMHKGELGTMALNRRLQEAMLGASARTGSKGAGFFPGDKVMHLKNDYARELFNGDIGTVADVDDKRRKFLVDYYGRMVEYDFAQTDELSLAYAVTVHKAQGSEYRAVIMPLTTSHYVMLERNLLYTAITRARELLVVVGTTKALDIAIKRSNPRGRLSLLSRRLGGEHN